uniref:Uncharacterized protein n=1 Tax=Oryzias latipes TaxID=8090 RepID=A0A3P9JGW4_ORYLA
MSLKPRIISLQEHFALFGNVFRPKLQLATCNSLRLGACTTRPHSGVQKVHLRVFAWTLDWNWSLVRTFAFPM